MSRCKSTFAAVALAALVPCALAQSAAAEESPPEAGRIVKLTYHPFKVYHIHARAGSFTNIEVSPGERIEGFYLSDTTFWRYVVAKDLARVLVRPSEAGQHTSGTLVTNKRVYELSFTSVEPGRPWQQRVQWDEPREDKPAWGVFEPAFRAAFALPPTGVEEVKAQGGGAQPVSAKPAEGAAQDAVAVDAARVNFRWRIEGQAPFRPSVVFDDGRFTYVRLPQVQDMPALFAIDAGQMRVVDYAVRGDTLIVHRISDALLLRLGQQEVRIVRHDAGR